MALLEDILRNVQQDKSAFASDSRQPSVVSRSDWLRNAFDQSMRQGGTVGSAPRAPEPTGLKGFVYDVLNNPVARPIVNALDVLAVPGRVVTSGLQEFVDAYDNNPNTRATFDDFRRQVDDPTFGFGRIIGDYTGNKWVDRLIGFAGDVVLDPLTYLTLGGSKALSSGARLASPVASAEGRFALAGKLFELGADPAVVKAAARRGRSAVKDVDLLAKAGYNRAGVYWMGKRIPGSTRVGEAAESFFTGFRVWSGDHIFKRVGDLFSSQDMLDLRRQFARGDVATEDVNDFLGLILSRNEERAVEGAAGREAKEIRRVNLGGVAAEDIAVSRGSAYKLMENPTALRDPSTSEGRVAIAASDHLKDMHNRVVAAVKAVDPEAEIGEVTNYFPHMPVDKAWRWMANTNDRGATMARGNVFNPFDDAGSFKGRMVAGDKVNTYTLTQADIDGGVDRLNRIFRDEYKLDFDFFETDLPTVLDKYDRMYASMMGKVARKKYLIDRGIYKRLEARLITDPVIEEAAQARIKQVTSMRSSKAKNAEKKVTELSDSMRRIFDSEIDRVQGEIDAAGAPIGKALMTEGKHVYGKQKLVRDLESAKSDLREAHNAFHRDLDEAARTPLVQALDRQMESLVDRLESLAEEVNLLDFSDATIGKNIQPVLDKLATLGKDIEAARKIEERVIKVGNGIAANFEAILNGSDVKDMVLESRRLRDAFNASIKRTTGARKTVYGGAKTYGGIVNQDWWKEIQDISPLSAAKVLTYSTRKKMKAKLQEIARGSLQRGEFGDTSALEDMRAIGAALVGWIDTMPDDIAGEFQTLKADLIEAITMASRSADYYKGLASKRAKTKGVLLIQNVMDNYLDVADRTRDTLYSYFAAQQLRNRVFSAIDLSTQADEIVPTSVLTQIIDDPEFAVLEPYLGRFADEPLDSIDSFDQIQELMGAVTPGQLSRAGTISYGELEQLLSRIVTDSEKKTFELTLRTGTALDQSIDVPTNVGASGVARIQISEYIARVVDRAGGRVTQENIDAVLGEYFDAVYDPWWYSFREQARKVPDLDAKGRVEIDMLPSETRVAIGGRGRRSPLREAERRAVQTGQKSKEEAKESLSKKSMEFLEAVDDEMRPGEVLSAEDAFDRLNSVLLQTYFKTEIQHRFSNLTRRMITEGLVPDDDVYRLVVNTVAKELSDHASAQMASYTYATIKLQEILDVIDGASADRARLRDLIRDPSIDAVTKAEAQKQLDAIPSSGYWLGREEELYDTVVKMLSAEGRNMELDWREIVAAANGSHHAESLYAELRSLGGANQQAGVTNRLRKLRQEFKATTDAETRARIKVEIESIEANKPFINKARRELLEKRLRPWYKNNIDRSESKASFQMIEDQLKLRKKINKSGGRLEPTASVSDIRTWVEVALENIRQSSRRTNRNFRWTTAAADPFVDATKVIPGVNNLDDLASLHAITLRSVAQQLEDDAANLAAARMELGRIEPLVESAEEQAALAERQLRELTRKGGRIKGLVPDQEVAAMRRAREISDRIVALKNTSNYLGAVERAELQELLMEMAKYSVRQNIPIEQLLDPGRVASRLIDEGVVVFEKKSAANPDELLEIARIRERIALLQRSFTGRKDAGYGAGKVTAEEFKREVFESPRPLYAKLRKKMKPYLQRMEEYLVAGDAEKADQVFWEGALTIRSVRENLIPDNVAEANLTERIDLGIKAKQIENLQKRLELLTERNPLGGERYREVASASSTKKGTIYFKVDESSRFVNPSAVVEQQKRIARAIKAGDEALANSLRLELDRAMVPIASEAQPLLMNGRALTFDEDLFRGLFDDVNERVIDVAENGAVKEYTLRQVALQRMSDILQAIKAGEFSKEDFIDALRHTSSRRQSELYHTYPEAHTSRVAALEDAWAKSRDKKILDEIGTLESEESLSRYRALISDREKVVENARKLREQSRRITGDVGVRGAPYGYEPYGIGNFNRFYREELERIRVEEYERLVPEYGKFRAEQMAEAAKKNPRRRKEAAAIAVERASRIPYTEPTVGFAGAEFRFNRSMEKLNTVFDDIKRTTNEQYDPYSRFVEITADGTSISDAVRIILREVEQIRPDNESFIKIAETIEGAVDRAEALRIQLRFLESNIDDSLFQRYLHGSSGLSGDAVFPVTAHERRLEMQKIGDLLPKLEKERARMMRSVSREQRTGVIDVSTTAVPGGRRAVIAGETGPGPIEMVERAVAGGVKPSKAMAPSYKETTAAVRDASKKVTALQKALEGMASLIDDAKIFRMSTQDQYARVVPQLRERLENLIAARDRIARIIENNPTAEQKYSELLLFQGEVEELLSELGTIKSGAADTIVNADSVINPPGFPPLPGTVVADGAPKLTKEYEKYLLVRAQFLNAWHEFNIVDEFQAKAMSTMQDLQDLKWGTMVNETLNEGWTTLEQLGLPSYQARKELLEISKNMQRMIQPEFVRGLNRFIGSYTGFVKAYLTASPGFVVRNTLSNSFVLVAAGGEIKNLSKGLRLYQAWMKAIKEGVEREFIERLPQQERELFEQAVKASDASGYGKAQDAIAGWQPKRQVLKDNKYTRLWRDMNSVSEGSARFMLAYDSVAKGMDFNMATARVKKYLFDYVDVGSADEALRSIIPFWFWMSRNLPMQIANRWTNPRAYLIYDKLMKNLRNNEEDQYLPSWMVTSGAVRLTDDMYLNLDLGFNRIDEELQAFGDPAKFLQKLNPAIKVPAEMLFGKRLGYSQGFGEEGVQAPGSVLSPAVQALAGLLGQSRPTETGDQGVSEMFSYALQSLLPPLAQSERLLPATESGRERQGNALLGYFGVPLRNVSDQDRQREMMRQFYLAQNR